MSDVSLPELRKLCEARPNYCNSDLTYDSETGFVNVYLPPSLPYYGGFIRVIVSPDQQPKLIRWKVFIHEANVDEHVSEDECLKLNLAQYTSRSGHFWLYPFKGFVMPSNLNRLLVNEDGKRSKVKKTDVFLFYSHDNTTLGSLYWVTSGDKTSTPETLTLDAITEVQFGSANPILTAAAEAFPDDLSTEVLDQRCLALVPKTVDKSLYLQFATAAQAGRFLFTLRYILRKYGVKFPVDQTSRLEALPTNKIEPCYPELSEAATAPAQAPPNNNVAPLKPLKMYPTLVEVSDGA